MRAHECLLIGAAAVLAACQQPSGAGPTPGVAAAAASPAVAADTLARLRRARVNQILATIAGRENQPAGTVFRNVQLSRDMPARAFLDMMDSTYGRALGLSCTGCHVATDFSSDARNEKQYARVMQTMVNTINRDHLPKLNPQDPPKATCMTCHRGRSIP
jgi:hypothetical protein